MPKTIYIHDVPQDVYVMLVVRAAEAGVSLSRYARTLVEQVANRPGIADVEVYPQTD